MADILVFSDANALIEAGAEKFFQIALESIKRYGRFSVALSGGNTPRPLFAALGSAEFYSRLAWENVHLFWGDERHVPPEHPDSNYRMIKDVLLSRIAIPQENIHRVPAELDIHAAAEQYEERLRSFFEGEMPRFDLVLLGMGEDGHTASLFPQSSGLDEEERWFIANYAPARKSWRLTLTKTAINAARHIMVLVSGASKAQILADVLYGEKEPDLKPIQSISPENGEMIWMVDCEAAGRLGT